MKRTYPIVIKATKAGYLVKIPDFDGMTQGETLEDAIDMGQDYIECLGWNNLLDGVNTPFAKTNKPDEVPHSINEIVTLVTVDFEEYKRKMDSKSVRC